VALIAGLAIMAAISLLALAAANSMALQQNMAANFSDQQLAEHKAAKAVSRGARFLLGLEHSARRPDCLQGCFNAPINAVIYPPLESPVFPEHELQDWWLEWAFDSSADPITGVSLETPWPAGSEPARFMLEEIHFDDNPDVAPGEAAPLVDGVAYYRLLGRGRGLGPAAIAVEEAIVARPWLGEEAVVETSINGDSFCSAFKPWYDCGILSRRKRR